MTEALQQVRTSERADFMDCRWKWNKAYNEKLRATTGKAPLVFGDIIHRCLEPWYIPGRKRGVHPAETFQEIWKTEEPELYGIWDEDGKMQDAYELGMEMCNNYVEHYGKDLNIEIIAPEFAFQAPIWDTELQEVVGTYVGKIDGIGIWLPTGRFITLEHKTTGQLPPKQWLEMDEQASSYDAYLCDVLIDMGILKKGQTIHSNLYNFLRKAKKDQRPTNEKGQHLNKPTAAQVKAGLPGDVSKNQPSPLFYRLPVHRNAAQRRNLKERVQQQVWEMKLARDGTLPIYKHITGDCKWKCEFRDVCELHEYGRDWESLQESMFTTWDPYGDHVDKGEIK